MIADGLGLGEGDEASFGAAGDGAGEVESGGEFSAAGQDEGLEFGQGLSGGVDMFFEFSDVGGGDAGDLVGVLGIEGGAEIGTEIEQAVLQLGEEGGDLVEGGSGGGEAEGGVGFVDVAVGLDAEVVFVDAGRTEEGGEAGVTFPGVDLHRGPASRMESVFQLS